MGKKKKADKAEPILSKKERKALAKREAEITAELARRAEKRAKKKAKKLKKSKPERDAAPVLPPLVADAVADAKAERAAKRAAKKLADGPAIGEVVATMDGGEATVIAPPAKKSKKRDAVIDPESGETRPEVIAERQADALAETAKLDAELKARLRKKREEREAGAKPDPAKSPDALDGESEVEYQHRKKAEKEAALSHERIEEIAEAAGLEVIQVVEEVETERGREFAVGSHPEFDDTPKDFAQPSEAPKMDFETNGNNQYLVSRPSDGKLVGYTRVTTYIGCLEDTTMLTRWKMRLLLEGVAAAEELGDDAFTARVRDLVHVRDMAIAKARKADRKGKLGAGELATYIDGAWSTFKKAMDALADEAFELGGGREKAQKGTDIHDLCGLAVKSGIDAVGEKLENGEITPADLADVEAFLAALDKLGAKVIAVERVVVNDELKVAGRLDYVVMLKLPGMQRSTRLVLDLKTGRVDLGAGKIAMQLGQYADAVGYDLDTHEREDLKLNRTKALVVHLPAGTAKATVHVVDLGAARRGNKLAAEVRAWRNEGKKAIDLKTDVLAQIDAEASAA